MAAARVAAVIAVVVVAAACRYERWETSGWGGAGGSRRKGSGVIGRGRSRNGGERSVPFNGFRSHP